MPLKVMRTGFIAALLLVAPFARGEDGYHYETLRCGEDLVVVFDETQSPDGHYALGWTIRPVTKDAKAVDWSGLEKKGPLFPDDYPYENEETGKAPYSIVDGIIDLRQKSFRTLPVSRGFYTNSTHGWSIGSKWLNAKLAIVTVNSRFWTDNLFLVQADEAGVRTLDLITKSNQKVEEVIEKRRPLAGDLKIFYNEAEITMNDGVIKLPFSAGHPKGSYEDLEGQVFISSNEGRILKTISNGPADQPFTGDFDQADKQLNQVYGELREKLTGTDREHLVAEQKKWIGSRNSEAREAANDKVPFANEGSTLEAYREARNQQALQLTRERTTVLRKQLDAASFK